MTDGKHDAYAAAGVDYTAMDPGKVRAQLAAAGTAHWLASRSAVEVAESRGESAYVIELPDRYLSMVTEALGTKNLVADAVRMITGRSHYDHIAHDTVATILNDLSSVGGQPLALTAYWGAGSSSWFDDAARMADLTDGWAAACNEARCAWGGGETQALSGVIERDAIVLGGSAVGTVAKSQLLLGSRLEAGDVMLAAPSTGIHANGLSLARKLAGELKDGYATPVPGDKSGCALGELLLRPAPLYGPLVESLQARNFGLHYAAHITGHGWRKLMRAPQDFRYVVEHVPEVPPVLRFLQQLARMDDAEAYGTFNMGIGYVFFVAPEDAERAITMAAQDDGCDLIRIGYVDRGPRSVEIEPLGVTFKSDSLQIR
jgi:phosphoribosylformylglycinamidine cyclo-ligase